MDEKKQEPFIPRKFEIGSRVIGIRNGDRDEGREGILLRAYYSINKEWKNAVYVIRYEDGRERKFGFIIRPEDRSRYELRKENEDGF